MVIQVLFVVLILSTAAILSVGLAIHFRVKRHLGAANPEAEATTATKAPGQDDKTSDIAGASQEGDHGENGDRNTGNFG